MNAAIELTEEEAHDLAVLEGIVSRCKQSFESAGVALARIRDGRLYRKTHSTFEDYCAERWGWQRAHAYRLIEFAEIKMSPIGDKIANEAQARELAKVEPERRVEVLEVAATNGGTAKAIREAAKTICPGPGTTRPDTKPEPAPITRDQNDDCQQSTQEHEPCNAAGKAGRTSPAPVQSPAEDAPWEPNPDDAVLSFRSWLRHYDRNETHWPALRNVLRDFLKRSEAHDEGA